MHPSPATQTPRPPSLPPPFLSLSLQAMEEKKMAANAIKNLETFYGGVPDDSVDLTFKYLTAIPQNEASEKKKSTINPIKEKSDENDKEASSHKGSESDDHSRRTEAEIKRECLARSRGSGKSFVASLESAIATTSCGGKAQSQRKGITHSNICAVCDLHIYIFKHRCLVCGRVYCKTCVGMGMGEMIEGRKCIECLGRKFSQRYITRAGKTGCCCGYPCEVKKQELIWAKKGASSSSEEKYGKSILDKNPRKPPIIPVRSQSPSAENGPSFSSSHCLPLEGG